MRSFALPFAAICAVMIVGACSADAPMTADPSNPRQVTAGKTVYDGSCATCHGGDLEGQPDWRARLPNGRMPAPPHDDSGHTWHHPDKILFGITKFGVTPPYGPPGYQSDMPAFGLTLTDRQIWDVLTYIKSRWSARAREAQTQMQTTR